MIFYSIIGIHFGLLIPLLISSICKFRYFISYNHKFLPTEWFNIHITIFLIALCIGIGIDIDTMRLI